MEVAGEAEEEAAAAREAEDQAEVVMAAQEAVVVELQVGEAVGEAGEEAEVANGTLRLVRTPCRWDEEWQ